MIASPRPMPPATKTGTSRNAGKISCAKTLVETGPIWPPASMPSITIASAPMRTSFLAIARAGAKHSSLAPDSLMRLNGAGIRQAAGEHDMSDAAPGADRDQLGELGMHGDEIDAERLVRALARRRDLGIELRRVHRAAGDDAEAAAIRDRRDEIALADPGHGAAHDRELAAEELERRDARDGRAGGARHLPRKQRFGVAGLNGAAWLDARRHTSRP